MEPDTSTTPIHAGDNKPEEKPLEVTPTPPVTTEPKKEDIEPKNDPEPKETSEIIETKETSESKEPVATTPIDEPVPDPVASPVDLAAAPIVAPIGAVSTESGTSPTAASALPEELKGWNWGAFFLTWIWAIGNQTWIGLLALISPISLIMCIVLGIKGNEWAWQNRKFENVDQFKAVQKAWAKWGLILFIISIVLMIGLVVIIYFTGGPNKVDTTPIPINLTQ